MWKLAGIILGFVAILSLTGWAVLAWAGGWWLLGYVLWVVGGLVGALWAHKRSAYLLRLSRETWGRRNWLLVFLAGPGMWLILLMILAVFATA